MSAGVTVDFNANLARFTTGVEKAINDLNKFENQGEKVSAGIRNAFAALGVGLSVGGLTAFIKGSIDAQDKLNDLRASTNLTIDTLTGLSFASKVSGGDLDSIAASVNKLAVNMGKDADKFKAIGVTAKDPLEAFKQLADVFVKVQDPQLRAALGAEALGKSWAGAAPLLMEGSKGIGELVEKGTRLSGVTEKSAKAADAFNDKMTELVGTGALTNKMVGDLLPLLNTLADDLIKSRDASGDLNDKFKPLLETGKAVAVLFGNVAFVFRGVGTEIGGIAAQLAAFGRGDFAGGMAIGEAMKADAEAARKAFDEWEKKIMGLTGNESVGGDAPGKKPRNRALEGAVSTFVGGKDGAASARLKEAEIAARAIVDLEEQAAKDTTEAWQAWEKIEVANHKETADALALQWKQVFATIDQEQEDAITAGQDYLNGLADDTKEVADFARDMGLSFSSAFEEAVIGGKKLSEVFQGLAQDVARIVLRKTVTEPLGNAVSGFVQSSGVGDFFKSLIPKYAQGTPWVPNDGMAYLHKGEQVIPAGKSGGGNTVVVNLIEDGSRGGQTQQRQTGNGQSVIDVFVDRIRSAVAGDIARGSGPIPAAMESTYGMNRAAGAF